MNNQVSTNETMSQAQLLSAMGMAASEQEDNQPMRLPLLKVNYSEDDADGNELKKGVMALTLGSGTVYGKDVKVRVYADYLQYLNFDPDAEEVLNRSVIHRRGDEAIDETGTLRCGKPLSRDLQEMSDDAKAAFANITCFRYLYCTVTMADATTGAGDPVDVTAVPALFRIKGLSFMAFNNVLDACRSKGVQPMQVESTITTERKKKGSVTYFVVKMDADMSNIREISTEDVELMSTILEAVKRENAPIREKYNLSLRSKQQDASDEALVNEVEGYLDADFEG